MWTFAYIFILSFELNIGLETYYRSINNSPILGNQLDSMGRSLQSHKCATIEKYGNIKVGIERIGREMSHK